MPKEKEKRRPVDAAKNHSDYKAVFRRNIDIERKQG
jgi:hypothetical protein